MISNRTYGVELETHICNGWRDLPQSVRDDYYIHEDGSIMGMEFSSAVFSGEGDFDKIKALTDYAAEHSWEVDDRCGYHLHIGVNDLPEADLKRIAMAYYHTAAVWNRFIPPRRRNCRYANALRWTAADIATISAGDFGGFCWRQPSRYQWFNIYSYRDHGTFEIRSHAGTVDYAEVTNWVRAHNLFIEGIISMGEPEMEDLFRNRELRDRTENLFQLWDESDLIHYYDDKITENNPGNLRPAFLT